MGEQTTEGKMMESEWMSDNCKPEEVETKLPSERWPVRSKLICAVEPLKGFGFEGRDEEYGWKQADGQKSS